MVLLVAALALGLSGHTPLAAVQTHATAVQQPRAVVLLAAVVGPRHDGGERRPKEPPARHFSYRVGVLLAASVTRLAQVVLIDRCSAAGELHAPRRPAGLLVCLGR